MADSSLLTVIQAARTLGCHPETIRRAIRRGDLSCYKFGGCIRLSLEQLQAYLDTALCPARGRKSPNSSSTGKDTTSSGGKAERVDEFRQERRTESALDSPLRTSKPNLNIVR
jgi:excisionase family DNA binding protein